MQRGKPDPDRAEPQLIVDRTGGALWFGAWRIGPATLHPLALLYAASGSAMISATLRVPKP